MFDLFDNTEHSLPEYGWCMSQAYVRKIQYQIEKNLAYATLNGIHQTVFLAKEQTKEVKIKTFNNKQFLNVNDYLNYIDSQSMLYDKFYYKIQNKIVEFSSRDIFDVENKAFKNRTWEI